MNRETRRSGFTIIELMMAMSFVSFLLIAIALTVIQIGSIYNKGITLKGVNQAGRLLTSELQKDISESSSFSVSDVSTDRYIIQSDGTSRIGGRLCLDSYSYIWNYGKYTNLNKDVNKYATNSSNKINIVKVADSNAYYCTATSPNTYPKVKDADAVEMLNSGEQQLALHSFDIYKSPVVDLKTGQSLYNIEFMIGTSDLNALNGSFNSTTCKDPTDSSLSGSDYTYCSVNLFRISARAGNTIK